MRGLAGKPLARRSSLAPALEAHRPLVLLLFAAAALRVVLLACFPGGVLENFDSGYYLGAGIFEDPRQPSGYHAALAALRLVAPSVFLIALVQHVIGLV